VKVSALTSLIFHINSLIDSGKYGDITIDEVRKAIDEKKVLRFLQERAGSDVDLSLHLENSAYGNFEAYFETNINDIYGAYLGKERRKWGIEHSGLCLILALTNEIVQRGENLEWLH